MRAGLSALFRSQRAAHLSRQECKIPPRSAIDLTYWEARQLGDHYIGTEHQLLGLIGEGENLAARVLLSRGADLERTRQEVRAMRTAEAPGSA
jgi:ATP-dependent Clp protease ATP-binding subunit ClpC